MAWIFELGAECGPDPESARALGIHFDKLAWTLSDGTPVSIDFDITMDDDRNWWAGIAPRGLSRSGPRNATEFRQMAEAARMLFDTLRSAPPRYRFACVGIEASTLFSVRDLPDLFNHPHLSGLVLSDELWVTLGRPSIFVSFSPGYRWRPYGGDVGGQKESDFPET
jgi:hypothetical protein